MVYYFRQPNSKVEYYEFYSNNYSLDKTSEKLEATSEDYKLMVWAIKYYNNVK